LGDYVTVELGVKDAATQTPIETDFDQGLVRLVCGGGAGFIPAIHKSACQLKQPGEKLDVVCSGGEYFAQATADIPLSNAPPGLKVGDKVKLSNGISARVTKVTDAFVTIDANRPLAGKQLQLSLALVDRKPLGTLQPFTAACGCFWGIELALQRVEGVAFTCVGYTQGEVDAPSYENVCAGTTGHAEAVHCLFDASLVSYEQLLDVFWSRHDPTQLNRQGNDVGTQYRGGVYYHSDSQKRIVEESMQREQAKHAKPLATELLPFSTFWMAEEYHQQYLERETGQSASKKAKETIRCYG